MLGLFIMISCIVFFYKVGDTEYTSGFVMAVISFVMWVAGALVFGFFGAVLGQIGLFAVLTAINIAKNRPARDGKKKKTRITR